MKYIKSKNEIKILDLQDFNVKQILDCGQIFRYTINGNVAVVHSLNKRATIITQEDSATIICEDVDYFENFFDLKTDYSTIKAKLKLDALLKDAVNFGYGIRILNNDAFEMIISFIISANNHISRIKKSIEYLCTHYGAKINDYFAFPTLEQLKQVSVEEFRQAGLGYRAEQMFHTVQTLKDDDISKLKNLNTEQRFKFLISLKGIGEKVANCIMLFGLGEKDVFPVDTWINKVYNKLMKKQETNRKKITKELTARYGNLSGYAQQYLFYYFRENKIST